MVCPICEQKVEIFDDPYDYTRSVCCNCKIFIIIRNVDEMDTDIICGENGKEEICL
jgi:hypothetical protein